MKKILLLLALLSPAAHGAMIGNAAYARAIANTHLAGPLGTPLMGSQLITAVDELTGKPGIVYTSTGGFLLVDVRNLASAGTLDTNLKQWGGTALGAPTNFGTTPGAVVAGSVNASLFAGTVAVVAGNGTTGTGSPRVTIASDNTPFPVKVDQTTPGTTNAVSVAQIGATTVSTGTGAQGAGAQRVTVATDSATVAGSASLPTGANVIGALTANQSVNTAQVNAVTVLTGTGATGTGSQRVTVATDTATIAGSAPGTAGTASAQVVSVQGVAAMTKLLVTPDSVALPANQSVNVAQINAVTPLMGSGIMGTGSPRVTIASDNDALTVKQATAANLNAAVVGTGTAGTPAGNILTVQGVGSMTKLLVTPDSVALPANQSINVAQVAGTNTVTGGVAGTLGVGGLAASGAAQAGNPHRIGLIDGAVIRDVVSANSQVVNGGNSLVAVGDYGSYNSTLPVLANTNFAPLQLDASGRLIVTPGVTQIVLNASQQCGAATATTTRTTTTGLGQFSSCDILINYTGGGGVTNTCQIFLEDSADAAVTYDDLVAGPSFAAGTAATAYHFFITGSIATTATQGAATAIETLTAGTVRNGPWGDRIRVREKVVWTSGTAPTYTINAVCKGS